MCYFHLKENREACLMYTFPFPGKRRLKDLLLKKDNRFCADCGAPDPKWA